MVIVSWPRHLLSCIEQYPMSSLLDFLWFSSGLWRTWSNYWHLCQNHQVSFYLNTLRLQRPGMVFCTDDPMLHKLCIVDDSSPVSRFDWVLGFISTWIVPTFGIVMALPLNVLELSLKSQNNDPVLESLFWQTGQFNF